MTRKTVQILAAIIVALVLFLLVLERGGDDIATDRGVLLPGLKAQANDARRISITRPDGEESVTIDREDAGWVVTERNGYHADVNKLGLLISALADAVSVEEKTSNPANYARLGVDDPGEGGSGVLVSIDGPNLTHAVILGKAAQREFRYARVPGEATSYLIDQNPAIPESAGGWLIAEILDIPSSRIRKVSIVHNDGETIVIEKTDQAQTDYAVVDVPEGRELNYATVGNSIAGALAGLELDDVRQRVDAPVSTSVDFDTWDGIKLSVAIIDDDETAWLTFAATSTSVDEEETTENEAATINKRLADWQYQIAEYKKNLLIRRWDDLLKAVD